MHEEDILQTLQQYAPEFIGDDAAVLPYSAEEAQLISKDVLIEDIHFRMRYFTPQDLAYKSLQVNLSDLAAMGAEARYVLCGISIPPHATDYALSFLNALTKQCASQDITLVGGDTTASPNKLYISITAIGYCPPKQIKYRHGAKAGDMIVITGQLGWARLGLLGLEQGRSASQPYTNACLRPKAKLSMGLWLGRQAAVTSMMDISDGLYTDLTRLAKASGLQALLELERLPHSKDFQEICLAFGQDPIETMLIGGEDYALLFTVSSASWPTLAKNSPEPLHCIGSMQAGVDLRITDRGIVTNLDLQPFQHFE